ncbi:hypothetical protein N7G274_001433 [Stereocaulon virgatum]|uniref:NHL repeat-containing protein n=1 Tax=Stereocaulon virgatum TaxID=373712 RepID=A0ABR4ANV0_9LECA
MKMLGLLLTLLFAPFNVLTLPLSFEFPADQLLLQPASSPFIETETAAAPSSAVKLVYQFQDRVALENLASRSNGHLVLTASNQPIVYAMNPNTRNAKPISVFRVPGVTGLTGVVETAPDVFAVVAGNWSTETFRATPGSFSVWSVDFNTPQPTGKIIASIPEASALNGLTTLEGSRDIILGADSAVGIIRRLNVTSGEHNVAIESPLFAPTKLVPLGVNGLCTFDGQLYFLNSAQGSYGRVPLKADGSAAGEVQILARINLPTIYDDFDMDWAGTAWVATHANMLTQITVEGKQRNTTGTGSDTAMIQPTSAQFGRGSKEAENTIYMTTAGNNTVGGQVLAINLCLT